MTAALATCEFEAVPAFDEAAATGAEMTSEPATARLRDSGNKMVDRIFIRGFS
jgi:hypothetical protein